MEKLLVLIGAVILIGFIFWWFFGKHKTNEGESIVSNNKQEVEVIVNGSYTPNTVVLKQGIPASIIFNRKDPSGCFNEVMFPDFGIHETLPVEKKYNISIDTSKPGEYRYACGMNMFHGKVIIK